MDNIEKNIAQGYADFTDDSEVTAEAGGNASFNLNDTFQFSEMSEINVKLRTCFDGKIVRKDLTKAIKEGANVPVYVLEFLLGQYCSSDDPSVIEEGVANVKRILADNYVRPDEAQKILSVLRQRGSYTVIDKITVNLNIKKDTYEAEFSNLGIKAIPISEEYPSNEAIVSAKSNEQGSVEGIKYNLVQEHNDSSTEIKYTFCKISRIDNGKNDYYFPGELCLRVGDFVKVPTEVGESNAIVIHIQAYSESEAPKPINETEKIIEKMF